jgi:hypothetical protein
MRERDHYLEALGGEMLLVETQPHSPQSSATAVQPHGPQTFQSALVAFEMDPSTCTDKGVLRTRLVANAPERSRVLAMTPQDKVR